MQGRQGPRDRPFNQYPADCNGTGKQRAIPRRPPNMARIDHPPLTQRVARPQREAPRKKSLRRRILFWGIVFVVAGALACGIGFTAVNFFSAPNTAPGAAVKATYFLSALFHQHFDQAYNELDA